jgi:hypothetical protein
MADQRVPIGVLLPLRLETRFRPGRLLLRVIPDEPWFTGHDPAISDAESDLLARYAGAGATPAAWSELVAAVGGPRAVYLARSGTTAPRAVEPALPRIARFPDELQVWLARGGAGPARVASLTVDHDRLLADLPDLNLADDRRWWEDFDEALRIGLAADLELPGDPTDIDALYVTGLGAAGFADHFSDLRDEGRLGLIGPGTATNSVDGALTATPPRDADAWFQVLTAAASDTERQVSRVLTGDPDLLGVLPGPDEPHRAWSFGAVAALWPALWGHAADDIWAVTAGRVDLHADEWAAGAMCPEGPFPTLRIGSQPYGLLPTTALVQWRAADADPRVERALVRPLRTLRDRFRDAALARGNAVGATEEQLMDLIGALPTSNYFRHRLAWPLEMWWLAMGLGGTRLSWLSVDERWRADFARLDDQVTLEPSRRYAARHASGRVTLPLVVPAGLADGDTVANVLGRLIEVAKQHPARFADTRQLEQDDLGLEGSSLLLRLLVRSLQVAIGDIGRGLARQPRGLPEPIVRPRAAHGRLETWIATVNAADLQAGTAAAERFQRVIAGIEVVRGVTVERLARLLGATVDCSAYRLDPWVTALPTRRLGDLLDADRAEPRLGAYGWVDAPRPGAPGPTAGGLLHAPSPNQALTAAVLRDRAINDPTATRWDLDLTSHSVRAADRLAEHVRVGAHLSEALGREVERILAREADVIRIRRAFPLREEHAGRRTCDGLAVLAADPTSLGVDAERLAGIDELRVAVDAYGDLLVAEAVSHVGARRADIAGVVMDAAGGLTRPPELGLLRNQRSGRTLFSEIVLVLSDAPPVPVAADASPAALADPAVAAFVDAQIGGAATWTFVGSTGTVTLADLEMSAPDALALSSADLARSARVALGETGDTGELDGNWEARYASAARLVGLIGRRPATPRDVSEQPEAADDTTAVVVDLADRLSRMRASAGALVGRLRDADPAVAAAALPLARRWGILGDSVDAAADELARRVAAAPSAEAAAAMRPAAIADAMAELFSPTRQLATTSRLASATLPATTAAPAADEEWLPVVAAVRESLATLETHQLAVETAAGNGPAFTPFANKAGDIWQLDPDDTRRLIIAYAAEGLDLTAAAGATVGVAVIDRFTEVVPGTEQTTGAAFGFDAPGARAPQAILLAVPPDLDLGLPPEILVSVVAETRDLARARMARPADLPSEFSTWLPTGLLPATGASATPLGPPRFEGGFG